MKKYLFAILSIAALLRIPFFDSHMPALYGDEVSIAYNAYSILTTGKDEFGKFLPLQFESWGDQKNPVYIYLTSLFQIFFGLSEWAVRLPSALAGIAAVYLTYLLTKKILNFKAAENQHVEYVSLLAALLLAINPWHIHISRGGYEANLALTLGLLGVYALLHYFQQPSKKYFSISLISFVLAMYTYYTTKMFIPMLLVVLFIFGKKHFTSTKEYISTVAKYLVPFGLLCLPIIYLALFSNGQARFQTINIFSQPAVEGRVVSARSTYASNQLLGKLLENKFTYIFQDFLTYYFENFSGQFWYVAGDSSLRYSMANHGMFYLIELPFFILGFCLLFKQHPRAWLLLTIWLLLAPIPTALVGRAYGLRSIAMLPIPMIFASYGLVQTAQYLQSRQLKKIYITLIAVIFLLSAANWLARYIYFYPVYAQYWYDSAQKEMIEYAKSQEQNYDHIILTRYYGKTEMYYAFYAQVAPSQYQQFSQEKKQIAGEEMVQFGKYYFGDINPSGRSFNELHLPPNTLIIGSPKFDFSNTSLNAKDDKRLLFKIVKYD